MNKILLLMLFIGFGLYTQAQTLKGYTLGEPLGNKAFKINTTVAEIVGVINVETDNVGNILIIKFNAEVQEYVTDKYNRIIETLFSLNKFEKLVNAKYGIKLKNVDTDDSLIGTPFEGLIRVGWNYYRVEKDGVQYSVSYYNTDINSEDLNKLELKIEDKLALKAIEDRKKEQFKEKEKNEFNRKLKDF